MVFVHVVDDTLLGGEVFGCLVGGCHVFSVGDDSCLFDVLLFGIVGFPLDFLALGLCLRYRVRLRLYCYYTDDGESFCHMRDEKQQVTPASQEGK